MKMKKKGLGYIVSMSAAVLLLTGFFSFTTSAAQMSEMWKDAIEEMEASDEHGAYQLIPEAGVNIWIPDYMRPVELDEEDKEQGFVSAFMTEDEAWSIIIACQHGEDYGLDELVKLIELDEHEYSYELQEFNGMEALVFASEEYDTANVAFELTGGGLGYVIFTPFSDNDFMEIAELIYLTIRPAISLHWTEYESFLEWIGIDGDFLEFSDAGFKLWVPEYMEPYDLTTEDKEAGYIGYFSRNNQENVIAIQQTSASVLTSPEDAQERFGSGLTAAFAEKLTPDSEKDISFEAEKDAPDEDVNVTGESNSEENLENIVPITDDIPGAAAASMFGDFGSITGQYADQDQAEDSFVFTLDYYRDVLDDYGASSFIDLEVNGIQALYYEIEEEDTATVCFLNASGNLIEVTYYPVSDEDFSSIIALSAASLQSPQTMSWREVSPTVSFSGVKGSYCELEEAGVRFWLPDEFKEADYLDDLREYAYIGYYTTPDEDAAFAIQYLNTGGMTLADYAEFVAYMGGEDISFANINGRDALTYMIPFRDTKGISFLDSDGYLLEFSFVPSSDEDFTPYFSAVASSITFE